YYSALPPHIADKLRDKGFLSDLEAHIETRLGRMSARDISLISRSTTTIGIDRMTEAFLRSKEIQTGNLLYYCVTLLKAGVSRPPVTFMNRLRREIDATFTQLKPAHIERFLHVFMNLECFSDERILICLSRATESNLDRMSQRRLRSILLAFHRLCKPTNSLLPQLAARVRAAVPREAIHAETIALLMRAFAVESPLKQQQNTRLILTDLGRQLVDRLRSATKGATPRRSSHSELCDVELLGMRKLDGSGIAPDETTALSQGVERWSARVISHSLEDERKAGIHPTPPSTVITRYSTPQAETNGIASIRYEPVHEGDRDATVDGLDEEQLAVLKQMEEE
ncbi:hypothetical protein Pmar_PMAR014539, partial [Perkinsus marinus ATCC 50983]